MHGNCVIYYQVTSFVSWCGGLTAPEDSNNPLRYKFSWSPEAAVSTVMNGAKYLENGQVSEVVITAKSDCQLFLADCEIRQWKSVEKILASAGFE